MKKDSLKRSTVKELLKGKKVNIEVLVKGWVRTKRGNKNINFIALNDGSIIHNIQGVVEMANFDAELMRNITTGSSIEVKGKH